MLVLSRKRNERIRLKWRDEVVWVSIADVRGDKVRVGVEAPEHVEIDREEVVRSKEDVAAA